MNHIHTNTVKNIFSYFLKYVDNLITSIYILQSKIENFIVFDAKGLGIKYGVV